MHPSYYYLKYLLAQAWDEEPDVLEDEAEDREPLTSAESLSVSLRLIGLPAVGDQLYKYLRMQVRPPKTFKFDVKNHKPSVQFMKQEKIYTLWKPEPIMKKVMTMIVQGHSLLKKDLHILLMGGLPHTIIADKLNTKYQMHPSLTEDVIDHYYHYFWNVGICSHEHWEYLLRGTTHYDDLIASLYCGEQQAMYRAGFSPIVNGKTALKDAFKQIHFRVQALRYMGDNKSSIDMVSKMSARMLTLYNAIFQEGEGLQEQLREFRSVLMKHEPADVSTFDELVSKVGSHSGDGKDYDIDSVGEEPTPPKGDLQ